METIHTRITTARKRKKLSMEALASELGLKSWQAVQQWENGKTAPTRKRLSQVAAVLDTTPEYLLNGTLFVADKKNKASSKSESTHAIEGITVEEFASLPQDKQDLLLKLARDMVQMFGSPTFDKKILPAAKVSGER